MYSQEMSMLSDYIRELVVSELDSPNAHHTALLQTIIITIVLIIIINSNSGLFLKVLNNSVT